MTVYLVWILVTWNSYGVQYSPPMKDLQSCERLQSYVDSMYIHKKCVQIAEVLK